MNHNIQFYAVVALGTVCFFRGFVPGFGEMKVSGIQRGFGLCLEGICWRGDGCFSLPVRSMNGSVRCGVSVLPSTQATAHTHSWD